MQAGRILDFLESIRANNNKEWFNAHRAEYDAVRRDFEDGVNMAILRISEFDPTIRHLRRKTRHTGFTVTRVSLRTSRLTRHTSEHT